MLFLHSLTSCVWDRETAVLTPSDVKKIAECLQLDFLFEVFEGERDNPDLIFLLESFCEILIRSLKDSVALKTVNYRWKIKSTEKYKTPFSSQVYDIFSHTWYGLLVPEDAWTDGGNKHGRKKSPRIYGDGPKTRKKNVDLHSFTFLLRVSRKNARLYRQKVRWNIKRFEGGRGRRR